MHSRGKLIEKLWTTSDAKLATIDDISVFVIPIAPYKQEFTEWQHEYDAIKEMSENYNENCFGKLSLKTSPKVLPNKPVDSYEDHQKNLDIDEKITVSEKYEINLQENSGSNIPRNSKKIDVDSCEMESIETTRSTEQPAEDLITNVTDNNPSLEISEELK